MSPSEPIFDKIEKLREELNKLRSNENLLDLKVLDKSKQLDRLITEYYELTLNKAE